MMIITKITNITIANSYNTFNVLEIILPALQVFIHLIFTTMQVLPTLGKLRHEEVKKKLLRS